VAIGFYPRIVSVCTARQHPYPRLRFTWGKVPVLLATVCRQRKNPPMTDKPHDPDQPQVRWQKAAFGFNQDTSNEHRDRCSA